MRTGREVTGDACCRSSRTTKTRRVFVDFGYSWSWWPEPGFVIKTSFLAGPNRGEKLFVNVCCHELVEKPHVQALLGADDQASGEEGIRIPLSVGAPML